MRLGLLNRSVPYWNVAWMMYCDFNLLTSSSLTSILLRPISSNLNNYTIGHLLFLLFFILHPFSLLVFFSSVWFSLNLWCFRIIPFPPFFFPPFLVSFLVTFLYYFLPWLFPLCVVYCVGTGWQLSLVSAVRHLFKMYSSACWYVYIRTYAASSELSSIVIFMLPVGWRKQLFYIVWSIAVIVDLSVDICVSLLLDALHSLYLVLPYYLIHYVTFRALSSPLLSSSPYPLSSLYFLIFPFTSW